MTDEVAGVEFVGLDNDGLENDGLVSNGGGLHLDDVVSRLNCLTSFR